MHDFRLRRPAFRGGEGEGRHQPAQEVNVRCSVARATPVSLNCVSRRFPMNELSYVRRGNRVPEDLRPIVSELKSQSRGLRQVEAVRRRDYHIQTAGGDRIYIEEELHIRIREKSW